MCSRKNYKLLMSRLISGREKGILTDIILKVENDEYKAHKFILTCMSKYFSALFNESMMEYNAKEVYLSMLTSKGFKIILDYMYTTEMKLNNNNIMDVLECASYLQIDSALSLCGTYLRFHINEDNVVDIINAAEIYSMVSLKKFAYAYLGTNLSNIIRSQRFFQLSIAQMKYFLAKHVFTDCLEYQILEIVLRWFLDGSPEELEEKLKSAEEILDSIIFSSIKDEQFHYIIKNIFPNEDDRKSNILYNVILEKKLQFSNSSHQPERIRGMKKAILLIGGITEKGHSSNILYKFLGEKKWHPLTKIPHTDQEYFGACVHENCLYLFGGYCSVDGPGEMLSYTYSYDPYANQWKSLKPMIKPTCAHTVTPLGDMLYVLGGKADYLSGHHLTCDSCHKYSVTLNEWFLIAPLPMQLCHHAACAGKLNGRDYIFVSGGLNNDRTMKHVYKYDPIENEWNGVANMPNKRVNHYMFFYKDKLYVCGGWNFDSIAIRRDFVDTIDVYDPQTDAWQTITKQPEQFYSNGIVMTDGKIYYIGGYTGRRQSSDVREKYYDIDRDTWNYTDGRIKLWQQICVTMYLAKKPPKDTSD